MDTTSKVYMVPDSSSNNNLAEMAMLSNGGMNGAWNNPLI